MTVTSSETYLLLLLITLLLANHEQKVAHSPSDKTSGFSSSSGCNTPCPVLARGEMSSLCDQHPLLGVYHSLLVEASCGSKNCSFRQSLLIFFLHCLLGFCNAGTERLLVYEFMTNRSLSGLLFGDARPQWNLRIHLALEWQGDCYTYTRNAAHRSSTAT
uniref:Uncharacterized protein n=1 Tax=Arundo donax TaxID=35708 RepID=A0A0A9E513_ARUDO